MVSIIRTNGIHSHGGSGYAWLGGYPNGIDAIYQEIAIPPDATSVSTSFWYYISTAETSTSAENDVMYFALINPSDNSVLKSFISLSNLNSTGGSWLQSAQFDLSAYKGQTIRVQFIASTDAANNTSFYIDDVDLKVTGSQQRNLSVTINGDGSVNSNPVGIACTSGNSGFCSHKFNNGITATLMPTASSDYIFDSWSGCTSLSVNNCIVAMTADKAVNVIFSASPQVRIPGVGGYNSLQSAYDSAASSCTIQARASELPALDFTLNKGKFVVFKGGYDSGYTGNGGGHTTMVGILTIGNGSIDVENLAIK